MRRASCVGDRLHCRRSTGLHTRMCRCLSESPAAAAKRTGEDPHHITPTVGVCHRTECEDLHNVLPASAAIAQHYFVAVSTSVLEDPQHVSGV